MIESKIKPLLVFGTRHGTIFNLTPTNLPNLPAIQLSVGDFYDHREVLRSLPEGMTLKDFLGYKNNIATYLTPYDFYKKECMKGCENSKIVKIKCNNGYTEFNAHLYDEIANIIKPEYLVTMTDYPSSQKGSTSESNKSHKRAINKTTAYLENSQLLKQEHPGTKVLATVHGGKNLSLISRSMEQILNHKIDGFVICDMCNKESLEEREEIYGTIFERVKLEKDKQYLFSLAGMGKIQDIKHGLKFGISIFQVNLPFYLAEQQKMLVKNEDSTYSQKVPQLTTQLKPIDARCKCYTCLNHSESYIAHLINCFELNAKVLLSIHNLQVYLDFLAEFD